MAGLQWTLVTVVQLVTVITLTRGQSNEMELKYKSKIWCTRSISSIKREYRQCEPQQCIYFNDDYSEVVAYPNGNYFCPPGHPLNTNVTLRCSSHSMYMDQYPETVRIPSLDLTLRRKGLYPVSVDNRKNTYGTDFCLKTDLDLTSCGNFVEITNSTHPFQLLATLLLQLDKVHEVFPGGHYLISVYNETMTVCSDVDDTAPPTVTSDYIYIVSIVSAIFLFLTVLVQLLLLKRDSYHTKVLICQVISTMVMFICIAVSRVRLHAQSLTGQFSSISVYYVSFFYVESQAGRFLFFIVNYVSVMSTYLWLNVIAYEIWKAFSYVHVPSGLLGYGVDEKRFFVMKSLYAWGISLAACFVVIGLSHDHRAAEYLGLTLVSEKTTFLYTYRSLLIFIYGPVAFLLVVNLLFFGLTIWNIRTATRDTALANDENSKKLQVVIHLKEVTFK